MRNKILLLLLLLAQLSVFSACSDNGDKYPSVALEFVTAQTGSKGEVTNFTADNGKTYSVSEDKSGKTYTANQTKRIVTYYELTATTNKDTTACIYSSAEAVSSVPKKESEYKDGIRTDSAQVLSIWMGKDYLNIVVNVLAQTKKHTFGFIEKGITTDATGHTTVSLLLYHDNGGDVNAYTKRYYLSVPLKSYADTYGKGITITFSLYTYDGTLKTYTFTY